MNHDMESLKLELAELQEPPKPTRTRRVTNNATVEKLHELCKENPRGLLQLRDELVGFLAQIDQPGHEQDRAFYLEAANGDGRFDSDRIGRGTTSAPLVCVSVLGNIQPDKLREYLKGYDNDGFIQRFQALVYADELPYKHVDRQADIRALNRVRAIVHGLACADFTKGGATIEDDGKIPGIRLDEEAQSTFDDWLIGLENEIRRPKEHALIREHFSKFRSFVPSLALINHLCDVFDRGAGEIGLVSKESLVLAIAQARYFESHARRMYGLKLGGLTGAAKLASRIEAGDLEGEFTARDVSRNGWSYLGTIEAVEEACKVLIDKKWLGSKRTEPGAQGGRPTVRYLINPKIKQCGSN
jgi:putative DNA primase/helicase